MNVKCSGCGKEFSWSHLRKPTEPAPQRDGWPRLVGCALLAVIVVPVVAGVGYRVFCVVAGVGR